MIVRFSRSRSSVNSFIFLRSVCIGVLSIVFNCVRSFGSCWKAWRIRVRSRGRVVRKVRRVRIRFRSSI